MINFLTPTGEQLYEVNRELKREEIEQRRICFENISKEICASGERTKWSFGDCWGGKSSMRGVPRVVYIKLKQARKTEPHFDAGQSPVQALSGTQYWNCLSATELVQVG